MLIGTANVSSVHLSWLGIPSTDVNGKFLHYLITYHPAIEDSIITMTTHEGTSIILSGLMATTAYKFSVAVVSSGGVGPNSSINITTMEGSKCIRSG